ncbi:MAG: QueT transporter family protein [Eubacteriales bacterium]|nr:QueT transporter family protein [Eubacteriales bacterium]
MKTNLKTLCGAAMIAAVYTVLSLLLAPISFGPIQCRISEMLVILPAFMPSAVIGVTLGCFLTNFLGGCILPDIIFGTLATFIGAVLTRKLTQEMLAATLENKKPSLSFILSAVLPPIISNTIIVPFVLKFAYGFEDALWFMMITVGIGEILAVGVLGGAFITLFSKSKLPQIIREQGLN